MFEMPSNWPKLVLDIFPMMVALRLAWEIYRLNKQEEDQLIQPPSGNRYSDTESRPDRRA